MYNLLLHKQKAKKPNRIAEESNKTEAHVAPLSISICNPSQMYLLCVWVCVCVCLILARSLYEAIIVLLGLENLVLPHELSQK